MGLRLVGDLSATAALEPFVDVYGSGSTTEHLNLAAGSLGQQAGHEVTASTGALVLVAPFG